MNWLTQFTRTTDIKTEVWWSLHVLVQQPVTDCNICTIQPQILWDQKTSVLLVFGFCWQKCSKHNYNGIYLRTHFRLRFCSRKRVQDTKQIATVAAGTVYPRTLSFGTICALVAMRPRFCSTSGVKDECQPSCRPLEMQHVMPNGFIFSLDLSHVWKLRNRKFLCAYNASTTEPSITE